VLIPGEAPDQQGTAVQGGESRNSPQHPRFPLVCLARPQHALETDSHAPTLCAI
jgi:hypothetical protein